MAIELLAHVAGALACKFDHLLPGALMFVATVVLWLGRKHYVMVPVAPADRDSFSRVVRTALTTRVPGQPPTTHAICAGRTNRPSTDSDQLAGCGAPASSVTVPVSTTSRPSPSASGSLAGSIARAGRSASLAWLECS